MIFKILVGAFIGWFAMNANAGWRNWNGYGPLVEGCYFRAMEPVPRNRFSLKPLKRTKDVVCWHYASELLK